MYVAPKFHRQGVATALLAHSLEGAPSLQLSTLLGFLFAHNTPSVALFKSFGFAEWAHLPEVAELDGVKRDLLILGRHVP